MIRSWWRGRPHTTTVLAPGHARQVIVRTEGGTEVWGWLKAYRRDADGWTGDVEYAVDRDYGGGLILAATRYRWLSERDVRRPTDAELAGWEPGHRRVRAAT